MITNSGKSVLAKYLLGQTPSYATHIAIGCGQTPLDNIESMPPNLETKEILDFEMLRIPIISRGLIEENGEQKISLTAEIPSENRYEITEIGLWSSGSNSLARQFDSRMIFNFQENWQIHDLTVRPIPVKPTLGTSFNIEDGGDKIFIANCGDKVLETEDRVARKEGPRFLNRSIFLRGDSSNIESEDTAIISAFSTGTSLTYLSENDFSEGDKITISSCSNDLFNVVGATVVSAQSDQFTINKPVPSSQVSAGGVAWITGSWIPEEDLEGFVSTHIHLNPFFLSLGRNNPRDQLSLALSVIDRESDGSNGTPDFVKVLVEFFRNEIDSFTGYAKTEIYIDSSSLTNNRYRIIRFPISDLITSPDFSSSEISVVRIFAAAYVEDEEEYVVSDEHYIAFDGLRLDNITTQNPLYKMVGYSPTRTVSGSPLIKSQNANNYVEFRFSLGVN